MTDEVISPLRRRMIEDMTIRKLTPKTQQGYIRTIKNLAAFMLGNADVMSDPRSAPGRPNQPC
jgi:integrase/recombinase XerD